MANIMDMIRVKEKPVRNSFDMSRRVAFTAKVGELLPIHTYLPMIGETVDIDLNSFTRTVPVNTAAYTRIREYYDFFFVPTRLLWRYYPTFMTQMEDNMQVASSIDGSNNVIDLHPYFSYHTLSRILRGLTVPTDNTSARKRLNMFGFNRGLLSSKLLHYLGYGDVAKMYDFPANQTYKDIRVNPFPILAYQKIYSDFFRNSQWEKSNPSSYNIDYLIGSAEQLEIPIERLYAFEIASGSFIPKSPNSMLDLRYCNWNKDYFLGLLPKPQYGDEANVSMYIDATNIGNIAVQPYTPTIESFNTSDVTANSTIDSTFVNLKTNGSSETDIRFTILSEQSKIQLAKLKTSFSILALRQAQALQKWKEIAMSAPSQSYKDQVKAIFGVNVPDSVDTQCKWLGGIANNVMINEVMNNNLSDDNKAEIRGKGIGAVDGHIKFTTQEEGLIMCIYHAVPLLDYDLNNIEALNLKVKAGDYANPVFDKIGMQAIDRIDFDTKAVVNDGASIDILGYGPRYLDYKTSYDVVRGGFADSFQTGKPTLQHWVAPYFNPSNAIYSWDDVTPEDTSNVDRSKLYFNYSFMKANPIVTDSIFGVESDEYTDTDTLLVNCNFNIKSVKNLDVNGLPY